MKAAPSGIDAELKVYVERLNARMNHLEQEAKNLTKDSHEHEEDLDRVHSEFVVELQALRQDVKKVEDYLMSLVKTTTKLVAGFKNSASAPQLQKLQDRADMWKGEQYITRNELKRVLRDEF